MTEATIVYTIYAIIVLNPLIMFLLWVFFGRDRKPMIPVEVKPPNGLDPMEMEYLLTEDINKSVFSMIILWASKGYVDLTKVGRLHLVKLKAQLPEDTPEHQRILFDKLFEKEDQVILEDLPDEAHQNLDDVVPALQKSRGEIVSENSMFAGCFGIVFTFISIGVFSFLIADGTNLFPRIVISVFASVAFVIGLWATKNEILGIKATHDRFLLGLGITFLVLVFIALLILIVVNEWGSLICATFTASYIIACLFFIFMDRRNDPGLYGRVLGFRNYMTSVEKSKLRELSRTNHDYALELLPYAILFNMGAGWTKDFEGGVNPYVEDPRFDGLDEILDLHLF